MKIYGAVLCGGKSKRMGTNKALLPYQEGKLIDHSMVQLKGISKPQALEAVLVSGEVEGYSCVMDVYPDKGPLGGLYSVLSSIQKKPEEENIDSEYLLLVPVDMPKISWDVLETLCSQSDKDPLIAHFSKYELPLLVKRCKEVMEFLKTLLESGQSGKALSLNYFISTFAREERDSVTIVPVEKHSSFVNTNTPEEWDTLHKEGNNL